MGGGFHPCSSEFTLPPSHTSLLAFRPQEGSGPLAHHRLHPPQSGSAPGPKRAAGSRSGNRPRHRLSAQAKSLGSSSCRVGNGPENLAGPTRAAAGARGRRRSSPEREIQAGSGLQPRTPPALCAPLAEKASGGKQPGQTAESAWPSAGSVREPLGQRGQGRGAWAGARRRRATKPRLLTRLKLEKKKKKPLK